MPNMNNLTRKQLAITIDRTIYDDAALLAKLNDTSLAKLVAKALAEYIENHPKQMEQARKFEAARQAAIRSEAEDDGQRSRHRVHRPR